MINTPDRFYVAKPKLRLVGAMLDGEIYPVMAGWAWHDEHGLVALNTYIGKNGEAVWIDGIKYHKVILPDRPVIKVLHPDFEMD